MSDRHPCITDTAAYRSLVVYGPDGPGPHADDVSGVSPAVRALPARIEALLADVIGLRGDRAREDGDEDVLDTLAAYLRDALGDTRHCIAAADEAALENARAG